MIQEIKIPLILFHYRYESEGSEVVPVTALRMTTAEQQLNNKTRKNTNNG